MAKGFKDKKGNFRPTGNSTRKSSKEKFTVPEGMIINQPEPSFVVSRKENLLLPRTRNKFRFSDDTEVENLPPDPVREKGNEVILKIVQAMKDKKPEIEDYVIHNTNIYNDYDTIQKTFAFAEDNVEQLLEWRVDGDPKTWKWESPLVLNNPDNEHDFAGEDNHNLSFVGDAYKGRATIVLMSPREFLEKACPNCLKQSDEVGIKEIDFDIRGKEQTQKTIDSVTEAMKNAQSVETPYLQVRGGSVWGHEGRHRAFSAIQAGIEKMPVYIYTSDEMSDEEREEITNDPMGEISPDIRN